MINFTDLQSLVIDEAELTVIEFPPSRLFSGGHDGSHTYPVHAARYFQQARTNDDVKTMTHPIGQT